MMLYTYWTHLFGPYRSTFVIIVFLSLSLFAFFSYLINCVVEGNLYTHMRTHTGMVYRCTMCDFTTGNRGHLTDHEQTHSNVRHKCDLCQRDYNTVKSLANHVRKYHKTNEGAKYLSQFQASTYISLCLESDYFSPFFVQFY